MTDGPLANETVVVPEHQGQPIELALEMDPSVARGVYSNLVLVSHSRDEFTLEFAYMQPSNQALVQVRVILPTGRVKDLAGALAGQLARHAERFGPGQ